jgi:hypothetical protein
MLRLFRPVAIFLLLYFAFAGVIHFGLPRLIAWHFANCMENASAVCSASEAVLRYWWLASLPLLFVATFLVNRVIAKRRAA